jgi:basic amino acid/polyamine antiporter, APA family
VTSTGPSGNPDGLLVRELGVRQLSAGIFNYTVGSGIFALPAFAVALLGSAAPLAYLACAVIMGLVVLCFAEAGSRVSATGGPYAYVEVALGPFVGFVAGIFLLLAELASAAAVGSLFAGSVAALAGAGSSWLPRAILLAVLAALAMINVRGVGLGARTIEVVTVAKLVPLIGFVLLGAAFVKPAHLAWGAFGAAPDMGAVLRSAGIVVFAFAGIEGALVPSGEVKAPSRTVPRAAFLGVGAATLLYLGIQLVAQGILGPELAADRVTPLASAAFVFAGPAGRTVMIAGAALSMFGFLSSALLAGPRCLFAFARDGFFPGALAAVHPRYRTPHVSIAVFSAVAAGLALSGTFERLAVFANLSALALYLLCAVAAWELRRRDLRADGEPFLAPGGPLVPILTCATILWLLRETVGRGELVAAAVVLGTALALYAVRWMRS